MGSALPVDSETKRKPNFTDGEKMFLVQQYELYKPILSSRLCDGVTNRQKQDIWLKITAELNARNPHVERTTKDVKKKWENLATQARKEMIDYRQNAETSPMVTPPPTITLKVLELLDDVPAPSRISANLIKRDFDFDDSADPDNQSFRIQSSLDGEDIENQQHNRFNQAAPEIDAPNDDLLTGDAALSDNEPSLQALMDLWKQRQAVAPIPNASTRESDHFSKSPRNDLARNFNPTSRRRRRDDFEDSDSNASPNIARSDVKRLKRLKLFLETEKLMLEKKKLELEIMVLSNQLRKDAAHT